LEGLLPIDLFAVPTVIFKVSTPVHFAE